MMMDSLQTLALVVISIFFALATISILLRIYSRGIVLKSFGWDDWCMTSVLLFNSGHQAILYYFIKNGAGLHLTTVVTTTPQHLQNLVFGLFAEEIMYTFMHFIVKTAFLLFYLRFATKTFRTLVYLTLVANFVLTLIIMLIYSLQCLPLDAFFHPADHPGVKCLGKNTQAFVPASFSIFLDVLIVLLPIHSLWKIQVSIRKRIALITILSLGFIVVIISCIRLAVLLEFDPDPKLSDFTWVLGKLIIISSIELEVAIMAANAPSLKTLLEKWFGEKKGSSLDSGYEGGSSAAGGGKGGVSVNVGSKAGRTRVVSSSRKSIRKIGGGDGYGFGYVVDCVPMTDVNKRNDGNGIGNEEHLQENKNRLRHTESEEQLWKNDSGIIVERSVGVEVSVEGEAEAREREAREREAERAMGGSRLGFALVKGSTPPIEEEGEEEMQQRGRKRDGVRDNFEAV